MKNTQIKGLLTASKLQRVINSIVLVFMRCIDGNEHLVYILRAYSIIPLLGPAICNLKIRNKRTVNPQS